MENDWPILEECPQYRHGLVAAALYRYPWEEDGYEFDFESFYPPIPDEPPWFRKLLESTTNKVRPKEEEDIDCCPICLPARRAAMKSMKSKKSHIKYYPRPVPMAMTRFDMMTEMERKRDKFELMMERNREKEKMEKKEIREDPVWNMDPIPCPFHILLDHFYLPSPGSRSVTSPPSLVTPEQLESTKQFLKELRATRGYNVKSTPHPALVSSYYFKPDDLDDIYHGIKKTRREFIIENYLNALIDHINFKTGKFYKLVNILNSVRAWPLVLLTFSAAASPAPQQTFIATVSEMAMCPLSEVRPGSNSNILECLLLPDYDAPCKTQPWDEEAIRKESFEFIKRRMTMFLGDAEMTNESSTLKREGVEVGEGSHTSAQKRQKCGPSVAEGSVIEFSPCDLLDASELDMLLDIVEGQKLKKEMEFALLRKRKLELEAELKDVVAKLTSPPTVTAQDH